MEFINDPRLNRKYFCPQCGSDMQWENEWEDSLVCIACGYSMDPEVYGLSEEEYQDLYPTKEQVLGIASEEEEQWDDEEYTGEVYEEECGELSHDD